MESTTATDLAWTDLRTENRVELRALVRIARAARKGAAAAARDYDRAVAQYGERVHAWCQATSSTTTT